MSKIGAYQPTDKFKNYSLPTSKPLKTHAFYKEKVWTLQEQIHYKLKKVAELLKSLYPKLTDDFSMNIKVVIEKNLETLLQDLDLMQGGLDKNPYSFNTKKLKTNLQCITEMKNVCDTLQTVSSYEREFKKLSKIKHALHELEHLLQPTNVEKSLEKAPVKSKPKIKSKPKATPAKKMPILAKTKKNVKEKSTVKSTKLKAASQKATPATKLLKPIKVDSKRPKKIAVPVKKIKQSAKKVTEPKPKLSAARKTVLKAKPKSKIKSSAKPKAMFSL